MSSIIQLNFFDQLDSRPLPLLIAEKWNFHLTHIDQDGNPSHYLYCARDWFMGNGGSKTRWSRFDKSWLRSMQPVEIKRKNRPSEVMEYVDAEDLYRIVMNMRPIKSKEALNETRNEVIHYLAAAGVKLDEYRLNPDQMLTDAKALVRSRGIEKRKEAMAGAQESHITGSPDYGMLTNVEYKILLGNVKKELVRQLNLTPAQSNHFRDQLGRLTLDALAMIESAVEIKFHTSLDKLTDEQQAQIVAQYAAIVAPGFQALCEDLKVDKLRNNPLFPKWNKDQNMD